MHHPKAAGAGSALPAAILCLGLAALAACGNSTYAPPMAPYTSTPSPGTTPSPATTPTPTATGSPGGAVTAADLAGTTFTSTSVDGHTLAPGTAVQVRFGPRSMAVFAGCNRMFGRYGVAHNTLRWTSTPVTTERRCSPQLTAQDQWLRTTFRRGLRVAGDPTSTLRLSNAKATIHLRPGSG